MHLKQTIYPNNCTENVESNSMESPDESAQSAINKPSVDLTIDAISNQIAGAIDLQFSQSKGEVRECKFHFVDLAGSGT